MGYALGVDLGTTSTRAAVVRDGQVEPVPLGGRSPLAPTVVLLKVDGALLFGEAAERRALHEPERVAREFKRRVGDDVPILLAGSPYSAQTLMALVLGWVLERVGELQGGPPDWVVVSHPANWGRYRRECFADAVRAVGLDNVSFVAEPQAAALHYAAGSRMSRGQTIAVYDLGGGTFDAAVLAKDGDEFRMVGQAQGIDSLGGIDFDEAVMAHVLRYLATDAEQPEGFDPELLDPVRAMQLRREVVEAKEMLSQDSDVLVNLGAVGRDRVMVLRRSELEEMIRPQVELTVACLIRAVAAADLDHPLDAVVLVGGSSRIPLVSELVGAELGRPVALAGQPLLAVALGAAIAAERHVSTGSAPPSIKRLPELPKEPVRAALATEPVPSALDGSRRGGFALPRGNAWVWAAAALVVLLIAGLLAWKPWADGGKSIPIASQPRQTPVAHPTQWHPIAPLPAPLEGAGSASFGDQLWVVGGNGNRLPLDTVRIFDPGTGKWRTGPKLPRPVGEASVVAADGHLFVLGGSPKAKAVLDTVYRLDDPQGGWQLVGHLPAGRVSGAAAFDGSRLVYAGGFDATGNSHSEVFASDSQGAQWNKVGDLPEPRDNFAAASEGNGTTWFFGGTVKLLQTVVKLNGNKVTVDGELPFGVRTPAAVAWPGAGVCLIGGQGNRAGAVYCISRPQSPWNPPPLSTARGGLTTAVVGDQVYAVGGYYGPSTQSTVTESIPLK
jgi:actin-like ATPase involved in cell morphogenesis